MSISRNLVSICSKAERTFAVVEMVEGDDVNECFAQDGCSCIRMFGNGIIMKREGVLMNGSLLIQIGMKLFLYGICYCYV
jgi:hypothetical protein